MSGRVVHFEIPFGDSDRAQEFYASAFGWRLRDSATGSSYIHADTGPSQALEPTEVGFINGGLLRREDPGQGPIVVIEVDDIEAALAKVVDAGGSVVLAASKAGDTGTAAYFKDVEGNIMGLWQRA
ncbi:hypothetical protein BJ980_002570 [Nocardioides daedukensis]|uniref:VOC domain-containing protein n=1 Tax=Nocardioides daedukensis TaxID=634462 RepID=A0A7Y9RZS2_9ACTN|nr:VOC family protein [Nocardioides daedukensis]NYG59647.1 hypothetical protein [Nocardioides daedukensis]